MNTSKEISYFKHSKAKNYKDLRRGDIMEIELGIEGNLVEVEFLSVKEEGSTRNVVGIEVCQSGRDNVFVAYSYFEDTFKVIGTTRPHKKKHFFTLRKIDQLEYGTGCKSNWWYEDRITCIVSRLSTLNKQIAVSDKQTTALVKKIIDKQSKLTGKNITEIADAWALRLKNEISKGA